MKQTNPNDYSAYVGIGHNGSPDELSEVRKLAEAQLAAAKKIEEAEAALKKAQEEYKELAERKIPEKMEALGINDYTTTNGITVEVEEKVIGGLLVENRPRGHAWLEENGYGAILKTEVIIPYPKKKLEEAKKLVEKLREENLPANLEKSVHHRTLDAFIREQLELGKNIPLDIFSVMRQRIAKITVIKKETK